MESQRIARLKARQERLEALRDATEARRSVIQAGDVQSSEEASFDPLERIESRFAELQSLIAAPVEVSFDEGMALLDSIRSRWNEEQLAGLVAQCKASVLASVVGPFALGRIVASQDKVGGNISTAHNAKAGVFASDEDRERYAPGESFDRTPYEGKGFRSKHEELKGEGDGYTGRKLNDTDFYHIDHVVSAKEIHQGSDWRRLTMSKEERVRVASKDENLLATLASINQSKQDKDLLEWMALPNRKDPSKSNAEYYEIDVKRAKEAHQKARRSLEFETAKAVTFKVGADAVITGAHEAGRMGLQQAIGVLLSEFLLACFDEVADVYKHGFRDSLAAEGFFAALKRRFNAVVARTCSKWESVVDAFKSGALSGFLSNIATFVINCLVTTSERVVRIIREGFFSIVSAIKIALFPPEGLTKEEAADAALKLLATGVITGVGIMAEEVVEKSVAAFIASVLPILAPLAGQISAVLIGALTGLAGCVLVYGLDQLDVFGVNNRKKHAFVLCDLDRLIEQSSAHLDQAFEEIMNPLGLPRGATT